MHIPQNPSGSICILIPHITYVLVKREVFKRGLINYFVLGRLEQAKNLFYQHDEPDETTKKGPLSFVLLESPFAQVSTVSRVGIYS